MNTILKVNVAAIAKMVVDFTVGIVTTMNSVDCGSNKISRTLEICFLSSSSLADLTKQEDDKLAVFFSAHIKTNQLETAAHLRLLARS